jgi:hypothetical protein
LSGTAPAGRTGRGKRDAAASRAWGLVGAAGLLWTPWVACQAGAISVCDPHAQFSAAQQDRLLRFSAIVKAELEMSGASLALVARSGLNLSRFGYRYSHAGLSLKASAESPWAVRQLYYACDEQQPRIFDQGMSAFLLGTDEPALGYVSVVFLPPAAAAELERTALDNRQALRVLGLSYSANAYPYSIRYQNCNQWVLELMALAWGGLDDNADPRLQAQGWLQDQGYVPSTFQLQFRPLVWLSTWVSWLHSDDHPQVDLDLPVFRVSMPASIENFVRAKVPGAVRTEFCHTDRHVVIHHGWDSISDGCEPGEQDTVVTLD